MGGDGRRMATWGGLALGLVFSGLALLLPGMPAPLGWGGAGAGVAGLLWGASPWLAHRWFRHLPGPAAAHQALLALRSTPLAAKARRHEDAPDGPLCFMATKLFDEGLHFHGRRPALKKREPVLDTLLFDHRFAQDGAMLVDEATGAAVFVDLVVERKALAAAIARLKARYTPR